MASGWSCPVRPTGSAARWRASRRDRCSCGRCASRPASLRAVFSADAIVAATARLDPESRALVELSARRGMSDEEIAGMLGVDSPDVRRRHEEALAQLAAELGDPHVRRDELRDRLLRVDEATWRGEAKGRGEASRAAGSARAGGPSRAAGSSRAEAARARASGRIDVADVPRTAAAGRGREAVGARTAGSARGEAEGAAGTARGEVAGATASARAEGSSPGEDPHVEIHTPLLTPAGRERRSFVPIVIGLIAAVVAVVFVVVLVRAGDDDGGSAGQPSSADQAGNAGTTGGSATTPGGTPSGAPARTMQRLNGTYGHGTAQLQPHEGGGAEVIIRASGFL